FHHTGTYHIDNLSLHDALPISHGIQSLDLLGRKLWQHNGKGLKLLMARIHTTLASASQKPELATLVGEYQAQLKSVQETTLLLRSEEHTSELQSRENLVCRLLL